MDLTEETYRYLGYKGKEPDDNVRKMAEECLAELEETASPRYAAREFALSFFDDDGVDCHVFKTRSGNLRKNLEGCASVILFAATLGAGVDHLIRRYSKLQVSKAVTMQAAATAMIEDYCDEINEAMKRYYEEKGLYLRPRFSPGYGDFALECQPELLKSIDASKRAGITLTDSLLMAPSKSVSAVIGVSPIPVNCTVKGCEACTKSDCSYRRG